MSSGRNNVRAPPGTRVASKPHASRGGNPYPQEMRDQVIAMWLNGEDLKAPHLAPLRHQRKFPSWVTCKRWIKQYQAEGHARPKQATGNKFAAREVHGVDLVNLAIYRLVRPKAYLYEVIAYINNRNPTNRPYSKSQIIRAEKRLGLTRKAASTTSDSAYLPINLHKRKCYWERSYPEGVFGEDVKKVIDIDECNFKLESQNRKFGKVTRQKRCDTRGKFKKGAGSVSLLMGVSGDDENPCSFHQTFTEGGTGLWRFYNFMEDFIGYLGENFPGESFLFTMDNLNVHKHPIVLALIRNAGHRVVFRAPYWSCDGAIEYVFNTIHTRLQMQFNAIDDVDELVNELNLIIGGMGSFKRYFDHVWGSDDDNE